jgi:hypothetical protein
LALESLISAVVKQRQSSSAALVSLSQLSLVLRLVNYEMMHVYAAVEVGFFFVSTFVWILPETFFRCRNNRFYILFPSYSPLFQASVGPVNDQLRLSYQHMYEAVLTFLDTEAEHGGFGLLEVVDCCLNQLRPLNESGVDLKHLDLERAVRGSQGDPSLLLQTVLLMVSRSMDPAMKDPVKVCEEGVLGYLQQQGRPRLPSVVASQVFMSSTISPELYTLVQSANKMLLDNKDKESSLTVVSEVVHQIGTFFKISAKYLLKDVGGSGGLMRGKLQGLPELQGDLLFSGGGGEGCVASNVLALGPSSHLMLRQLIELSVLLKETVGRREGAPEEEVEGGSVLLTPSQSKWMGECSSAQQLLLFNFQH